MEALTIKLTGAIRLELLSCVGRSSPIAVRYSDTEALVTLVERSLESPPQRKLCLQMREPLLRPSLQKLLIFVVVIGA